MGLLNNSGILWVDLHLDGPGRPVVYNPEWDLRALMLRMILQLRYVKDLVKLLRRSAYFREACGYRDKLPTEAHFSQMKKCIGKAGFKALIVKRFRNIPSDRQL
jgi:hypothetical protein